LESVYIKASTEPFRAVYSCKWNPEAGASQQAASSSKWEYAVAPSGAVWLRFD
jgi:beta-N-acetylglucosaminidase